jgi:Tfp pilus assembly protein FimT
MAPRSQKGAPKMKSRTAGYSVAELLTVVAIVGLLTLASVPAFMTFRNAGKMRVSVRTFTGDLRGARQRAITGSHQVLVTFSLTPTGAATANQQRTYYFFDGNLPSGSTVWTPVNRTIAGTGGSTASAHTLDDVIYFPANTASTPQTFADNWSCTLGTCTTGTDNRPEVIFFPDGHVAVPANSTMGQITIQTNMKVPTPKYIIQISPSGNIKAVAP